METLSEYNLNLSEARPGIVAHDQYIGDGESQILPAKLAYSRTGRNAMIDSLSVLASLVVLVIALRRLLAIEKKKPSKARQGQNS